MKRPLRILLCPSAYYPSFGGVEEICRNLARELQQMGHTTAIAVNQWPDGAASFEELWGTPVHRFPFVSPSKRNPLNSLKMLPVMRDFTNFIQGWQPDLLHVICPSNNSIYLWASQLRQHRKLLLTFQGELFMDQHNLYGTSAFARFALKQLLSVTDEITGCSQFVLDDASKRFELPKVRQQVVFNAIDLNEAPPGKIDHPRPFILGLGRLVENKGFAFLIEAFSYIAHEFPNLDLILVGDGDEKEHLKKRAADLAITDRVIFAGKKNREEVPAYFNACSFFVLPSPVEPFGIVCLEAMRAGKPVIATNSGGPPEFISHEQDGLLVPPCDSVSLSAAIRRLATDPDFCQRLGNKALQRSRVFGWREITRQYESIYEELCGSRLPDAAVL